MERMEKTNGKRRNGGRKRIRAAGLGCLLTALCVAAGCAGRGHAVKLSRSTVELTADDREAGSVGGGTDAAEGEEFQASYLNFSLELLRQSRSGQNVMVSPASVLLALEMTRCGADGETLSQMNETLYPGITPEQGREGAMALHAVLNGGTGVPDQVLTAADSVWIHTEDTFVPDENFLRTVAADYDAQIYGAPFDETTRSDINRWVEAKTNGQIRDILSEISRDAKVYLINAVSFDGEWEEPYKTSQVNDAVFRGANGSETTVSMMYSSESRYLSGDGVQGFVKPYKNGVSFVALLPDEGISLEEFLAGLDGETFLELLSDVEETEVETGLPKFENTMKIELADILSGMGMPEAFSEYNADFTGMGYCTDGRNLFISKVLHQTHICVDEQGTKAAAATVVETDAGGAAIMGETVILNRPFLYAIVENESGLPVFLGTVELL